VKSRRLINEQERLIEMQKRGLLRSTMLTEKQTTSWRGEGRLKNRRLIKEQKANWGAKEGLTDEQTANWTKGL
jgi:hypothetical protein